MMLECPRGPGWGQGHSGVEGARTGQSWSPGWRLSQSSPILARLEGNEGAWEVQRWGRAAAEATARRGWHLGKGAVAVGLGCVDVSPSQTLTIWVLPAP